MNGIDRTQHVLQPVRAHGASPDRRRKKNETRSFAFEFEAEEDAVQEAPAHESRPAHVLSNGGDEGVGEFVNIVV